MKTISEVSIGCMVAVRNMRTTISDCLTQVVSEKFDEIVVIDGQSTDGTSDIIDLFPVRHLYDPGLGLAAARNIALRSMNSEYIVFPDGDQYLSEGFGAKLRQIIQTGSPDVVMHRNIYCGKSEWATAYAQENRGRIWIREHMLPLGSRAADIRVVRRSVILALNGWDSTLRAFEDLDFWYRLRELKVSVYHANDLMMYADESDASPITELRRGRYYGRGFIRFLKKHRVWSLVLVFPPFDCISSLFESLVVLFLSRRCSVALRVFLLRQMRSFGYALGAYAERAGAPY